MLDQHARQAETIRRLETALEIALDPAPPSRTPKHAIRRERHTKPCPMRCGNLCDRDAKRCGSCYSNGLGPRRGHWKTVCERCGGVQLGKDGETPRPCAFCKLQPVPVAVVPPPAPPLRNPNIVRAGTCLEGDYCPRWFCRPCNTYWLGDSSAHDCVVVRDSA